MTEPTTIDILIAFSIFLIPIGFLGYLGTKFLRYNPTQTTTQGERQ